MKPPFPVQAPSWVNEFKSFIMRGNVVDLAVGIIIGAAFTGIVNSLVKDVFTPVIGLLTGGVDFTNVFITLKGPTEATLEAAQKVGAVTINVGLFLNAVIQFAIVAFAIFWLVKVLNRFKRKEEEKAKEEAPPVPPRNEVLLEEIRDAIRQRPFGS
ncbi:MAG: large conductance mechanosensitive channel protein MscL [Alphaproteobacteria bacterium]|nr:large conductance mechanosensitive channel protein MscL [Alphaproteobacteria bacterium]